MPKIDLNEQFSEVLRLMETTQDFLLVTGKAGTGKSTLLEYFCATTKKSPVVLAPTGVAALNVKGQTIHRFFGFNIKVTPDSVLKGLYKPWRDPDKFKMLETLVIDEVSMVRADLFDSMDVFLRKYGPDKDKPFGGVRVILFGDLYQLSPIVPKSEREFFQTYYSSPYFFSAKSFEHINLKIIELETIFRQKEQNFIDLLGAVRDGTVTDHHIEQLNARYYDSCDNMDFDLILTTINDKANAINRQKLEDLSGDWYSNQAKIEGNVRQSDYPTEEILDYRVGTQIMLLNNDSQGRWVNGTIGHIKAVKKDQENKEYLDVLLKDSGKMVPVYPHTWDVYTFSPSSGTLKAKKDGSFTQYPFRLGWAVTIHKSQGQTVNNLLIDLGKGSFATGQTYVALSRCTSFAGVHLSRPLTRKDVLVDDSIKAFLLGKKEFWHSQESPAFVTQKQDMEQK